MAFNGLSKPADGSSRFGPFGTPKTAPSAKEWKPFGLAGSMRELEGAVPPPEPFRFGEGGGLGSSGKCETVSLTKNLSELRLQHNDRPRPRKIRRRNALTILDRHYPDPAVFRSPDPEDDNAIDVDAFQTACVLQSVENEAGTAMDREPPLSKRKLPSGSARSQTFAGPLRPHPGHRPHASSTGGTGGQKTRDDIAEIRLHQDLASHVPRDRHALPPSLTQKYRGSDPCHALVLYKPPESFFTKPKPDDRPASSEKVNAAGSKGSPPPGDSRTDMDVDH